MDQKETVPKDAIENYYQFLKVTLLEARALIIGMVSATFSKQVKADQSFVTQVDLAVETLIRERVAAQFPTHGVLGEELPTLNPDSDFIWICDPIDGTQNLVHQLPTYGCILGLHFKGRPIVGGIDHPMLKLCYTAGLGLGAWENDRRLQIHDDSKTALDTNDIVAIATRGMFERSGQGELFDSFMREHPSTRIFYDCFSTTRAVAGQVAALVEFNVRIWDLAASEILVTEAGGAYRELQVIPQEGGAKEPLRSVILGHPWAVEVLREKFTV